MEVKAGDYLLTKEKQLYRIVDVFTDTTGTYYDIKAYKNNIVKHEYIKAIPRNRLKHLGNIISEENITKTLKILYG